MASTAPLLLESPASLQNDYAYLLLGDLRWLLEEPADMNNGRWLLAVLDALLAHRTPLESLGHRRDSRLGRRAHLSSEGTLSGKLQRLRDRVAHHKPFSLLANELRCDLKDLLSN